MAKQKVQLQQIGRKRPEAITDDLAELAVQSWATDVITDMISTLRTKDAIASNRLAQSLYPTLTVQGSTVSVKIFAEDYYKDVDKGIKPGTWPKKSDILLWLKFRPRVAAEALARGTKRQTLAFLISRKIFKEGDRRHRTNKPTLFFTRLFGDLVPQQESPALVDLRERLENALARSVEVLILE